MSSKKLGGTPSSAKKRKQTVSNELEIKQSNKKKSGYSTKTIGSFFHPISNRSLCHVNNLNVPSDVTQSTEIICPSPTENVKIDKGNEAFNSKGSKLSPIFGASKSKQSHNIEIKKSSSKLKLKRKNLHKVISNDDTTIIIEEEPTVKLKHSLTNLYTTSCDLPSDTKNDAEGLNTIVLSDTDECSTSTKSKLLPLTYSNSDPLSFLNDYINPSNLHNEELEVGGKKSITNVKPVNEDHKAALLPLLVDDNKFQLNKQKLNLPCIIESSADGITELKPIELPLKNQEKKKSVDTTIDKKQQMSESDEQVFFVYIFYLIFKSCHFKNL